MPRLHLKHQLAADRVLLGTWSQSASPEMLEIVGHAGFDFTVIDTEHGYYGLETAENLVRTADAAGIAPLVRVAVNEPHLVMKALDIGAQGVVVPQVTTPVEAERAVSAARYHPKGTRGACPCIRAGAHYITEWDRHATRANEEVVVVALIEGKEGMARMHDILAVPGLDAVMVGPFDLSVSLGVGGQLDHPLLVDFVRRVIDRCRDNGVALFMPVFDLDLARARAAVDRWTALGCRNFTVGTDKMLFAHYMKTVHEAVRPG